MVLYLVLFIYLTLVLLMAPSLSSFNHNKHKTLHCKSCDCHMSCAVSFLSFFFITVIEGLWWSFKCNLLQDKKITSSTTSFLVLHPLLFLCGPTRAHYTIPASTGPLAYRGRLARCPGYPLSDTHHSQPRSQPVNRAPAPLQMGIEPTFPPTAKRHPFCQFD